MRWIRSLMALGIAGLCAVAASRLAEPTTSNGPTNRALIRADAIDPDRVDRIELTRDGRRFVFERNGLGLNPNSSPDSSPNSSPTSAAPGAANASVSQESWRQVEPVTHAADTWAVRQFITRVLKAESVRHVDAATETPTDGGHVGDGPTHATLAAAGLAPAIATVTLREAPSADGARREVVVELGRRSLAGRAFARLQGDAGYDVVDGALHEFALERDLRDFRRRELFPDLGDVTRVVFVSGANRTELIREKNGYMLVAPVKTRADRQQSEELIDALRRARSAGFIVDDPREPSVYGIDPPAARIEVETATGTRALRIGDAVSLGAQDRFGLVEGTVSVVRLPAAEIAGLVPRADRLIDALATSVRPRDVATIEIILGDVTRGERLTLTREISGWSATRAAEGSSEVLSGAASTEAVERLLTALCETRAGAVEIAAFPEEGRVAQVTFRGFANEPLDTVRIARRTDGKTIFENGDGVLRVFGAIDVPVMASELGFTRKSTQ